ncbi:MAG TPA: GNAT family N-acetyltransferase [Nitrososphaeraceae archaeon]|jgi:ribosomal protein S18 acetylase RimI-like enzyme|nr:GNAT family N-acetyltransferase [Nitrososphaeraceae archaeon]HET8793705.1 GNAT family N-acetyltransferase [Nitrososphaeraceae archaeon]
MTIPPIVKIAKESDKTTVIDALKLAFVADPATRWVWSDTQKYLSNFSSFVNAFGGKAFTYESVYYIGNYSGVALWLPPNVHPDVDQLIELLQSSGSNEAKNDGPEVFEKMSSYHPNEPHWYLPLLGVDPLYHGKGLGSALMQHAIVVCELDKNFAYLESSNPKSIPFYERHGFELLGKIQVNTSPPIFPMLRKPHKLRHN